ncbi:MAG: family 16 glycoside hydrolase [Planctomycetota bacterium]
MRRFIILAAFVCLAAGDDEIPGWKISTGQWSYDAKKEEIKGEGTANAESKTFPLGDFDMDFRFCIDDYSDPHNMAGISFRVAGESRYKLSFRCPNLVTFDKTITVAAGPKILASQSMTIPKGKWIPVQLTARRGNLQAKIGGKITLKAADPDPLPPGVLALSVFNTTARFIVKQIKVKDK